MKKWGKVLKLFSVIVPTALHFKVIFVKIDKNEVLTHLLATVTRDMRVRNMICISTSDVPPQTKPYNVNTYNIKDKLKVNSICRQYL